MVTITISRTFFEALVGGISYTALFTGGNLYLPDGLSEKTRDRIAGAICNEGYEVRQILSLNGWYREQREIDRVLNERLNKLNERLNKK